MTDFTDMNKILQEIYGPTIRDFATSTASVLEYFDKQTYARPYTEAEKERLRDISDMEYQYWVDQYDLAKSKFTLGYLQILYLHRPLQGSCQGCNQDYWPCRTVKVTIKGTEDWPLQFDRPKRPKRKPGKGTVTIPITTRRPNA